MNITSFGPYRAVGMSMSCRFEGREIPSLWERFLLRIGELDTAGTGSFGFCRCIPGATDGSFEYVAAVAVNPGAVVPPGMIAIDVPAGDYAVGDVARIADVRSRWEQLANAVTASDWTPYCGPQGCDCAFHPSFEHYPPDFLSDGPFQVYIPVHK